MKAKAHIAVMRTSFAQRGAATVGIAFLIVLLMGAALSTALSLSGSVAHDAALAEQQVQALFIAESGMERATQRFVAGGVTSCESLTESSIAMGTTGSFKIDGMDTLFDGETPSAPSCRVRIIGKSGQVARVIESIIAPMAAFDDRDFTCTVPTGSDLMLIVSVAWNTSYVSTVSVTSVTFNGAGMVPVDVPVRNTDGSIRIAAQNFRLLDPTVGTDVNGRVNMSGGMPAGVIVGCTVLTGVDRANPIDTVASASGNGPPIGVTIKTGATHNSGFVIDNLVRDKTGDMDMVAATDRESTWEFHSSSRAGSGSFRGPLAASTEASMDWTWDKNKIWAIAALAVRANSATGSASRPRGGTGLGGGGVTAWREVIVPPS